MGNVKWSGTLINTYPDHTKRAFPVHGVYNGASFGEINEAFTDYETDVHSCSFGMIAEDVSKVEPWCLPAIAACAVLFTSSATAMVARCRRCRQTGSVAVTPLLAA